MNKILEIILASAVFSAVGLIFATASLPSVVTAHGVDGDGDMYSPEDGDCNDDDPTIFPGAVEIPNDGVDQNCDGAESSGIGIGPLVGGIVAVVAVLGATVWYVSRRSTGKEQTRRDRRRRRYRLALGISGRARHTGGDRKMR